VAGADGWLAVELSGLPVFDRNRKFRGYRGFGICRDVARVVELAELRQAVPGALPPATPRPPRIKSPLFRGEPPPLVVVPPSENVVPFRAPGSAETPPTLTPVERKAFRDLASRLSARLHHGDHPTDTNSDHDKPPPVKLSTPSPADGAGPARLNPPDRATHRHISLDDQRPLLDRLPIGLLVYRLDALIYANRAFLEWTGHRDLDALEQAGGLDTLFLEPGSTLPSEGGAKSLVIATSEGDRLPVEARLFGAPWDGKSAFVLMLSNGNGHAQRELMDTKRQEEKASAAKSDFLAKVSHEMRTPLGAIIGFAEVMMQERFGPIGNERYRQYLKDIHTSGRHLISLLNDLLDLSKIEAGQLNLSITRVDLNELTRQSVALMQEQANRGHVIIRTSLAPALSPVLADARSVCQILLNLLSNSIKFTGTGGQVIVSTALNDGGDTVLRVRDTGVGMSAQDIAVALEPFRQLATALRWGTNRSGLRLPLIKALAEANRASFSIRGAVNTGTLVEVAFAHARVAAE
jgi:signal transduction histidine kinase